MTLYCSFCGKSQHQVLKLIAGPDVNICDECVQLCNDMVRETKYPRDMVPGDIGLPEPAADEGVAQLISALKLGGLGNVVVDAEQPGDAEIRGYFDLDRVFAAVQAGFAHLPQARETTR